MSELEVTDDEGHESVEPTYAEHLHPARPRTLRFRPRVKTPFVRRSVAQDGPANGNNPAYVEWLRAQSMLADANEISAQFSGQGSMWQNPYATPNPRAAVDTASVWFTAYPLSLITRADESFLKAMASEDMWKAFAEIGNHRLWVRLLSPYPLVFHILLSDPLMLSFRYLQIPFAFPFSFRRIR